MPPAAGARPRAAPHPCPAWAPAPSRRPRRSARHPLLGCQADPLQLLPALPGEPPRSRRALRPGRAPSSRACPWRGRWDTTQPHSRGALAHTAARKSAAKLCTQQAQPSAAGGHPSLLAGMISSAGRHPTGAVSCCCRAPFSPLALPAVQGPTAPLAGCCRAACCRLAWRP